MTRVMPSTVRRSSSWRASTTEKASILAEIVEEYLIVSEQCYVELVRLLGEGDCPAIGRTAHTSGGRVRTWEQQASPTSVPGWR